MSGSTALSVFALGLMAVGLVGAVLPVVPGAPLIWLAAALWAWSDGFERVGAPTLALLALLAMLSWATDLLITTYTSRRAGAGWVTVFVSIVAGMVGAVLLGGLVPLIGPVIGAIIGASAGIVAVEYRRQRDWHRAWSVAGAYVLGYILGSLAQVVICLTMIVVFVWQAFL